MKSKKLLPQPEEISLKLEEEEMLKVSGLNFSIVRPILMYGWNLDVERKNPVTWLIDTLIKGETVSMVDDIFCNPLYTGDCAAVFGKLLSLKNQGYFMLPERMKYRGMILPL